jgi:hypothetical protein
MNYHGKLAAKRAEVQRRLAAMPRAEAALHRQICKVRGWARLEEIPPDELERQLYVTPVLGGYGVAGYVVTLEGSPPRFLAVVLGDNTVRVLLPRFPRIREIDQWRPKVWQPLRSALLAYIAEDLAANEWRAEVAAVVRRAW